MALLTVRNLVGRFLSAVDSQLDDLQGREILDECYRELFSTWDYSFGKVRGTIVTTAVKTSGTVSVTASSSTLTGASTSFATGDVGSFISVGGNRYDITAVSGSTGLVIGPAYVSSANTAATYTLFKSYYNLTTNASHIIAAAIQWPLYEVSERELDRIDPQRNSTGQPIYYTYRGMDTSALQQIELYPAPASAYVIRYVAFSIDEIATSNSKVIVLINNVLLKKALEQGCMQVAAKKDDPNVASKWVALADRYGRQWHEGMILLQQWDMSMRGDMTERASGVFSDDFTRSHDTDSAFLYGIAKSG